MFTASYPATFHPENDGVGYYKRIVLTFEDAA